MKKTIVLLLSLLAASAAFAAEEAGAHEAGIPWVDILKQAVNFAVLAGVLVYFLRKPLASFLKERNETLKKSIEEAAKAQKEAKEQLAAIDTRMANLSGDIADMNRRMEAEAEDEARRLREAAEVEIDRIRQQAQFAAEQEVKKAREELRREAADLSGRAAEELVKKAMTPDDQERLVRDNIEKIREILK